MTEGARPAFPEGTPDWYTSLAARCWSQSPRHRPSFRRIAAHLVAVPPEHLCFGMSPSEVLAAMERAAAAADGAAAAAL